MTVLTRADAPTIDKRLIDAANVYAADGGIAIIGRPAPWGEVSPSHGERFTHGAFVNRVPPLLLAEHRGDDRRADMIADGLAADDSGRLGFDAVWGLRDSLTAVDHLFGHLADGISGLSVEMRVDAARHTHDWAQGAVREIDTATMFAVAVVDEPSYPSARIMHVVTPDAVWTYSPAARRLIADGDAAAAYVDARLSAHAADRARDSAALHDRIADALAGRSLRASAIRPTDRADVGPIEESGPTPLAAFTVRDRPGP